LLCLWTECGARLREVRKKMERRRRDSAIAQRDVRGNWLYYKSSKRRSCNRLRRNGKERADVFRGQQPWGAGACDSVARREREAGLPW
jgi:hypothetical protein